MAGLFFDLQGFAGFLIVNWVRAGWGRWIGLWSRRQHPARTPELAGAQPNLGYRTMPSELEKTVDQHAALRRLTPDQRWQAARRLYWTMRRHKAAFLKSQHPEWSEGRVEQEIRGIFLHGRS